MGRDEIISTLNLALDSRVRSVIHAPISPALGDRALRKDRQAAKQAVRLLLKSSGEIDRVGVPALAAIAVDQSPEVTEHDGVAVGAVEGCHEGAGRRIE